METYTYYSELTKPFFAPPSWIFGPVWTLLYIIIVGSFGYTIFLISKKKIPAHILFPMGLNILSNVVYTPLQFGLKNNLLASIDIFIVLFSLLWLIKSLYPHSKTLSLLQVPYLLWVSFATLLQVSVTVLNW